MPHDPLPASTDSTTTATILVADDSPTIASMLSFMLQSQGYRVVTAEDGIEAIAAAYQDRPDLILLDIEMPRMNGYQTCRLLKDDAQTKDIPIIMLTSKDQRSDRFWGLSTGADEYLTKDFEPEELFGVIERCLTVKTEDEGREEASGLAGIAESDMLERVNDILDRKLFQTTILNEVAEIAKSIHDHRAVIRRVLEFLYRVVDYRMAGMFLLNDGRPEMTVALTNPADKDQADGFLTYTLAQWEERTNQKVAREQVDLNIVTLPDIAPSRPSPQTTDHRSVPLEVRGRDLGLVCVATDHPDGLSEESLQTVRLVANHGVVVVDNAMLYARTEQLAITDGLTGLYNHRYFKAELKKEVERCRRFGLILSLMVLDIDFFKSFNDSYGHPQGDVVIQTIASIIRRSVRDVDFVARYGGEEFAVILLEADEATALEVAERVRSEVESCPFEVDDGEGTTAVTKTISIGLATCKSQDKLDPGALFQTADDALYQAKDQGRNRVVATSM